MPQSHNDSVLGLASVIDAIVILGVVLNNCSDTANKAADIICNATRVSRSLHSKTGCGKKLTNPCCTVVERRFSAA